MSWWWCDEILFPTRTRWRPLRDWAKNANESKFYNKIFPRPASTFSKEQIVFPHFVLARREAHKIVRKKCKQSHCARDGSSQLEMMLAVHSENRVKLRWKFDFSERKRSREETLKQKQINSRFIMHEVKTELSCFPLKSFERNFQAQLRVADSRPLRQDGEKYEAGKFYFLICGWNSINKA